MFVHKKNFESYLETIGNKAKNLFLISNLTEIITPTFVLYTDINWDDLVACQYEIIAQWNKEFAHKKIILRSSANIEDGIDSSFAGIFESIVISHYNEVEPALHIIKQSLSSSKLLNYINKKSIDIEHIRLNLIIQEYIPETVGGVIFSVHPKNPELGILVNMSTSGAKAVVEGKQVFAHTISYDSIPKQKIDKQIVNVVNKLTQYFKTNLDIEFIINKHNKLVVLQVRPAHVAKIDKNILLDCSNIQENLPDQILPLTYSFLEIIYRNTYYHLIAQSSSYSKAEQHKEYFENLLAYINGYVYYNIGNWYNFGTLLPFARNNNTGLKEMIGGRAEPDQIINKNTKIHLLEKISYITKLFYKIPLFKYRFNNYQKLVKRIIQNYSFLHYETFGLKALEQYIYQIDRQLEKQVCINAENDFLLMKYSQFIKKRYGNTEYLKILNYINTNFNFSSNQITNMDLLAQMKSSKNDQFENFYLEYELMYNGRFAQDLNLAKPKPELVIQSPSIHKTQTYAIQNPSLIKKYLVSQLKKYLLQRESNRLLRSQLFDIYRSIFNSIGAQLMGKNLISHTLDIHYLSVSEILKLLNANSINHIDIYKPLIKIRKKMLKVKTKPFRAGLGSFQTIHSKSSGIHKTSVNTNSEIRGEPCSSGKIYGIIGKDILVISNIDPGMMVDLITYKGIIILEGGLLSHGAIIARELCIPAIINVTGNIDNLKNGNKIILDADSGIITLL